MVEEVTARLGTLDILVNNAGLGLFTTLLDLSEDDWDAMVDTNLKGAFLCAQAAAPGMVSQRWGRIVNITSTGSIRVVRGMGAYCASKAGLAMLTQALAVELGRHGTTAKTYAQRGTAGAGPQTGPDLLPSKRPCLPGLDSDRPACPTARRSGRTARRRRRLPARSAARRPSSHLAAARSAAHGPRRRIGASCCAGDAGASPAVGRPLHV
jgi:NAD(P)-dependent dehydrogenase (short-subunit alcohol dehydrogenase family)